MPLSYNLVELNEILETILGPEAQTLIESINEQPGARRSAFMFLPSDDDAHLSPDYVARLIGRTSNEYAKACRLAGLARAQYKIAYAAYKQKFRTSLGAGRNAGEREGKAAEAAQAEFEHMTLMESIVELCESIESSARIASESARRMLLGADQYVKADARVDRFAAPIDEKDFTPY